MIELSILKCFLNKQNLISYKELLNPKTLSRQSLLLIKDFEVYFDQNKEKETLDINDLQSYFFQVRHPYLDDKSVLEYKEIFHALNESKPDQDLDQLIISFKQQLLYDSIKKTIETNQSIDDIKLQIEQFDQEVQKEDVDIIFEDMNLKSANEYTDRSQGLKWRCKELDKYFDGGGLIQSDFILVAGYTGQGKSSFIASELSFMGQQLEGDDYILWLSNEGNWKSLLPRLYCAALNTTSYELRVEQEKAIKYYNKIMKGNQNRIRILDIQGWTAKDIEKLVKKQTPKLLAIDLVDNIEGFDKYSTKENSWEKYGKLYQWCREIATKHCPVLGVSQLNGEGEDNMYPKMSQLRGSRIEKQSACTALLTIGSIVGDNSTRYLSMPKSKVRSDLSDWKAIIKFDAARSRYL